MNKSIKLIFNYLLAPVLFVVLSYSLYRQLMAQPDLDERFNQISSSWKNGLFWLVVLLSVVNWGIEARKWQLLLRPLERSGYLHAFKSVLAGCSVTMLTPNRVGEFAGRILYVSEPNRLQAISATIVGSISQLLITLIFGTCGIILIRTGMLDSRVMDSLPELAGNLLMLFSICITVITALFYLRIGFIVKVLSRFNILKNIVKHIKVLDKFTGKQLLRILFLSCTRYMVFILQYIVLLNVMDVKVSMVLCFWLLTIFYLVMAVAPTIGFIELPVRAAASVQILSLYSPNILGIQAAALGIWLINLVMPALIGSLLIFGIKILKER